MGVGLITPQYEGGGKPRSFMVVILRYILRIDLAGGLR